MQAFLERYWFAVALSIGAVVWVWRTRRRIRALARARPRSRPSSGSVGPVPFRGAEFAAKVATVQRFHWTWIGAMIGFGLVCVGAFVVPGLSHATRIGVASAGAAGAFLSWLVGAIREAPLLRQLGLYCPHCGAALVEASEDRVPLQMVVRETGQCRCGAWLLDPADLPSGQGPDDRYLSRSRQGPQ